MTRMENTVNIVVAISDAKVSSSPQDVLLTYSLGSCIGVALYDRVAKVAGLLHYQLPTAAADPQRASEKPLMYADTGMRILMELMLRDGAEKHRMQVHLAGGANMLNDRGLFDIGRRNHASIRKILWQNGMLINAEHVGGTAPRNMEISVADGAVVIKCNSERIAI
ncbi:MAG: chemotaxis protein CheD [Tepidisphaeraceae bacterium]